MTSHRAVLLLVLTLLAACGGDPFVAPPVAPPVAGDQDRAPTAFAEGAAAAASQAQQVDRQVIYRAAMDLTVEDPMAAAARVEVLVADVSGYLEASEGASDDRLRMNLRVPGASLEAVMDGIRPLGEVDRETMSTTDVTSRVIDLEARIQSLVAVRDRLRGYIDRAGNVEEIIQIERELTRVQTELEILTAELERTRGQVTMSTLGVTLRRDGTDGPVLVVAKGVGWFFKKLVVWN